MAGRKISQVAKEIGLKPKELLEFAQKHKFDVATIQSYIDEGDINRLKKLYQDEKEGKGENKPVVKKRVRKKKEKKEETPAVKIEEAGSVEKKAGASVEKREVPAEEIKEVSEQTLPPEESASEKAGAEKNKPAEEDVSSPATSVKEESPEEVVPSQEVKEEKELPKEEIRKAKVEEEEFHPRRRIVMKRKRRRRPRREEEEILMELEDEEPDLTIPVEEGEEKRKKSVSRPSRPVTLPPKKKVKIKMGEKIMITELARGMSVKLKEVMKKVRELGFVDFGETDTIDYETASLIASEYGIEVENIIEDEETLLEIISDDPDDLLPRPPVVTVMGHVDHGKTSLLDAIRETRVAENEEGGITQHIGASVANLRDRGTIVFVDTPGHEAFTEMRARGAQVTDIVVLVVAADDGVMPQTEEAISHAKAASVPIVVAINKIDVPDANPEKVKQQLSKKGLIPEEWGGDTLMVEVSAKKKIGIEDLLEAILLQAEMMELKANPKRRAQGIIIESRLDKHRGPLATVIVRNGTLHVGDYVVAGMNFGKVRALISDIGKNIREVGPSFPAEIMGLDGVPPAGEKLYAVKNDEIARKVVEMRKSKVKKEKEAAPRSISLEDLYKLAQEGEVKELNLVIKADVQGAAEAVEQSLEKLSTDEVKVKVVYTGVGAITESDVMLASASIGIIVGFNVRPDSKALKLAKAEGVEIYTSRVIYELIDIIKKSLEGMLLPEDHEVYHGRAEVRQVFNIPKVGTVAGCYVEDGFIKRSDFVRILREGSIVFEGKIGSLKRFKEDVSEVKAGYECGLSIEGFNDIKAGDLLETYEIERVKRVIQS